MSLISTLFNNKFGKLHFEHPDEFNQKKPTIIFFHGGSPKSQHTEFWKPILEIIKKCVNPILLDRYGHGRSIITHPSGKIGLKDHIQALTDLVKSVMKDANLDKVAFVGRSAGAGFALRIHLEIPEMISGLGLIAPGSLKSNIKYLETWKKPLHILWDERDPVVKFSNYQLVVERKINHDLYLIGGSIKTASKSVSIKSIKASHVPEILAPKLFEAFLSSLSKVI